MTQTQADFTSTFDFARGVARRSGLCPRDLSDDAAADAILELWPRRADPGFEGRLVNAVRRRATDYARREAHRLFRCATLPEAFDVADEPPQANFTDRVDAAVAALPERDREVAGMMFSDGMSARAAAHAQTGGYYADRRRIATQLPRLLRLMATLMEFQAA